MKRVATEELMNGTTKKLKAHLLVKEVKLLGNALHDVDYLSVFTPKISLQEQDLVKKPKLEKKIFYAMALHSCRLFKKNRSDTLRTPILTDFSRFYDIKYEVVSKPHFHAMIDRINYLEDREAIYQDFETCTQQNKENEMNQEKEEMVENK
jgi:hypothetical protein